MSKSLATSRQGAKGSTELWYDTDSHSWLMHVFVQRDNQTQCYQIDLAEIEQRHNIDDMVCNNGEVPVDAKPIEMSPLTALIYK